MIGGAAQGGVGFELASRGVRERFTEVMRIWGRDGWQMTATRAERDHIS